MQENHQTCGERRANSLSVIYVLVFKGASPLKHFLLLARTQKMGKLSTLLIQRPKMVKGLQVRCRVLEGSYASSVLAISFTLPDKLCLLYFDLFLIRKSCSVHLSVFSRRLSFLIIGRFSSSDSCFTSNRTHTGDGSRHMTAREGESAPSIPFERVRYL